MPTGPKGRKRPADVIGNAVKVMRIATGEDEDAPRPDDGKDQAVVSMGRKGGDQPSPSDPGEVSYGTLGAPTLAPDPARGVTGPAGI